MNSTWMTAGGSSRTSDTPYLTREGECPTKEWGSSQPLGHFYNAHDFIMNNPQFVGITPTGKTVFDYLEPYIVPGALMDSSARYPPPRCHPGTRLEIGRELKEWLNGDNVEDPMMWLFGSAGTGKSAVAQTFAEDCTKDKRHGASYFFSRTQGRNETNPVVATLAYQFSVNCPKYKSILTDRLVDDPQLFKKALPVQFQEVIVKPFMKMQDGGPLKPLVVVLDGLDECAEERAQRELVRLIAKVVREYKNLPLVWLICSRPEAHLKHEFTRIPQCGKQELAMDAETRDDVERYLRDELARIKRDDFVLADLSEWPMEEDVLTILRAASSLFVFASTVIKYIDDSGGADPTKRLEALISFLKRNRKTITTNPLEGLDLLYLQILGDIPENVFPDTWRILAHLIDGTNALRGSSARVLCNALRFDQQTFYNALRNIFSVVDVPSSQDVDHRSLRLYHASFQEFLTDPTRSGKYAIIRGEALTEVVKTCFFWHEIDTKHFHTNDGWDYGLRTHNHASLPGLKWTSPETVNTISNKIAADSKQYFPRELTTSPITKKSEEFLCQLQTLDFRYLIPAFTTFDLAQWIYQQEHDSSKLLRTEPINDIDLKLLEYMKLVMNEERVIPVSFPLDRVNMRRRKGGHIQYFFLGRDEKSVIIWVMHCIDAQSIHSLNADKRPSEECILQMRKELEQRGWPKYDIAVGSSDEEV
ncbi:hypothetical protein AGABI2DRAFT_187110 [Agaricus bisporus var. bisporus H97]|uniref:hypothetical protein n=1 Tax=Agaricus bisporus var. bisporus (strain H97 / ATCC MYA-4626 / FGSC 10389) TaxID=936046 RepID=UPI00029F4F07|nr:hypothetical protein AGABI2DRAFT_187110 [Agaricus bisporus var. bisporus H97]EKV45397.1 hypothetical protein AGABI2DRAFT_187110 [Agaricus bisporus var. bisporus H97]